MVRTPRGAAGLDRLRAVGRRLRFRPAPVARRRARRPDACDLDGAGRVSGDPDRVSCARRVAHLADSHVLTRRIPAVETLGSATVLCVDKTGTLTINQMSVAGVVAAGGDVEILGATRRLLPVRHASSTAILASKPDAFDPMERAFHALGRERGLDSRQASRVIAQSIRSPTSAGGGPRLARRSTIAPCVCRRGERRAGSDRSSSAILNDGVRDIDPAAGRAAWRAAACACWVSRRAIGVQPGMPESPTGIRAAIPRPCGPGRSGAPGRPGRDSGVPVRRHQGRDDHRRLSRDGAQHRAPDWTPANGGLRDRIRDRAHGRRHDCPSASATPTCSRASRPSRSSGSSGR